MWFQPIHFTIGETEAQSGFYPFLIDKVSCLWVIWKCPQCIGVGVPFGELGEAEALWPHALGSNPSPTLCCVTWETSLHGCPVLFLNSAPTEWPSFPSQPATVTPASEPLVSLAFLP